MIAHSKLDSKLKLLDITLSSKLRSQIEFKQDGGVSRSYYVMARHRSTNKWFKATILASRFSKNYLASQPKTPKSYEYYVHYEELDKRNDNWVAYCQLKQPNQQLVVEEKEQIDIKDLHPNDNPHFGLNLAQRQLHKYLTKIKTIQKIRIGDYLADTWYYSPYPRQYQNLQIIYICQFCLSFYARQSQLVRHDDQCPLFHPPGNQIYRDQQNKISVFEIDGEKNPVYCQNLGYFSKLFLDHKNLSKDMSIFLFYVLCQIKDNQFHIAGYFSKVKQSQNNLSCILVLPFCQRKGYGKFLISFSYELSLIQGKTGGPQKPLSDLGRQTYLSWWSQRIIEIIQQNPRQNCQLSIISQKTAIKQDDIKWCLKKCDLIKIKDDKIAICVNDKLLGQIYQRYGRRAIKITPSKIHYLPYKTVWQERIQDDNTVQ